MEITLDRESMGMADDVFRHDQVVEVDPDLPVTGVVGLWFPDVPTRDSDGGVRVLTYRTDVANHPLAARVGGVARALFPMTVGQVVERWGGAGVFYFTYCRKDELELYLRANSAIRPVGGGFREDEAAIIAMARTPWDRRKLEAAATAPPGRSWWERYPGTVRLAVSTSTGVTRRLRAQRDWSAHHILRWAYETGVVPEDDRESVWVAMAGARELGSLWVGDGRLFIEHFEDGPRWTQLGDLKPVPRKLLIRRVASLDARRAELEALGNALGDALPKDQRKELEALLGTED